MGLRETVDKVKEAVGKVIPAREVDIDELKRDVVEGLSRLYYKFGDDPDQKRAFRETMQEVADMIAAGKWESFQKKLYRKEKEA